MSPKAIETDWKKPVKNVEFPFNQRGLFTTGSWILGQVQKQGSPTYCRTRAVVPDEISIEDYPCLLRLSWHIEWQGTDALIKSAITEEQIQFDDVMESMEDSAMGIMMFALTGKDRREWFWYVKEPRLWIKDLCRCLKNRPVYPIEIEQIEDHDWSNWGRLNSLVTP